MEILRDFSQITQKNKEIFGVAFNDVAILDPLSRTDIIKLVDGIQISDKQEETTKLAELIFQLRDYSAGLENYIKMFLFTKYYEGVYFFLSKLFVAHIKGANYTSKNYEYSLQERFFDRFIEVVKTSDLNIFDYIEFLFNIIEKESSIISIWKRPAIEYMQTLFREQESEVISFVKNHAEYQKTYFEIMLSFNSQKAINMLFNDVLQTKMSDQMTGLLLKEYFDETMAFFDKNLPGAGEKRFHYIKLLCSIGNTTEVQTRLEDLYEEEKDIIVKDYIKGKLGLKDNVVKYTCSSLHFNTLAMKKVKSVQNSVMGLPFNNLNANFKDTKEPANNTVKTFVINIFDENNNLENLYELKQVCDNFDDGLYAFASTLFDKVKTFPDINRARWAIRLISISSYGTLEQNLYDLCYNLFVRDEVKQAKYLLKCLIYCKKQSVIDLLQQLTDENIDSFMKEKDFYYQLYSQQNNISLSDLSDKLTVDEVSEEALILQGKKLYNAFIENKKYTPMQFDEMFVCKKLYNELAQGLIFGEYKNERLYSLFMLKGQNKEYILDTKPFVDSGAYIKLVHSLDLDEKYEDAKKLFKNKYVLQFSNNSFDVKKFNKSIAVGSMHGILINAMKFIGNLQNFGFIKNFNPDKQEIDSMLYLSATSNLLAEVEFEMPIKSDALNASLGNIRFYKMSDCIRHNNYFILNRSNSLPVKDIPYRLFDYILSSISKSLKN